MTAVASNANTYISDKVTQPYSKAYDSLRKKFRSSKNSLNNSSEGPSFEQHFDVRKVTVDKDKNLDAGPNSLLYLGTEMDAGKKLVLKVLLKDVVKEAGGLVIKRPQDFSKVHTNVAVLYEFCSINASSYSVVTDYYPKGSLAKLLEENGPLQERPLARDLFHSALQGLRHLHDQKLTHRNLKLENLLLDEHNRLVLTDFWFSIIIEDNDKKRREAAMSTSLPYLAPEVLSNRVYDPKAADVFSFGVCLYIALSDCLPLEPPDSSYSLKQPVNKTLSGAVKNCLNKMLQHDVNRRASTLALSHDPWFHK